MKVLLALKADFKAATGLEWKPGVKVPAAAAPAAAAPAAATAAAGNGQEILDKIKAQGDKIRQLKAGKADKVRFILLDLLRLSIWLIHCGLKKSLTFRRHFQMHFLEWKCRKTSNISHTLAGNEIVDNSDVVGASPVGPAPTTSSFST